LHAATIRRLDRGFFERGRDCARLRGAVSRVCNAKQNGQGDQNTATHHAELFSEEYISEKHPSHFPGDISGQSEPVFLILRRDRIFEAGADSDKAAEQQLNVLSTSKALC